MCIGTVFDAWGLCRGDNGACPPVRAVFFDRTKHGVLDLKKKNDKLVGA